MKKLFATAALFCMGLGAFAQSDSKMAAGVNLNVGVGDSYTNVGLGAKFQYRFLEKMRGEASFNYFFPKWHTSYWDINMNAHYLFHLGETGLTAYPLAGFSVIGSTYSILGYSSSSSSFALNYGGGIEYQITDNIKVNAEMKGHSGFASGWGTRGVFSIGASYCF